jgi:hypothetical protein
VPGPLTVKVDPLIVVGSIPSLKIAEILWLVATPTARLIGFVDRTVGAVVSESALVVKVHTKSLVSGTSPALLAPVAIVPVNVVLTGSKPPVGAKIAVLFEES